MTVDQAILADRAYFDEHPDEDEYIRQFVPGEFGQAELPDIPEGWRFATVVSVTLRGAPGEPAIRMRNLIIVCDDPNAMLAFGPGNDNAAD